MNVRLISFTVCGAELCEKLTGMLRNTGYNAQGFSKQPYGNLTMLDTDIKTFTGQVFSCCDAIIFISAVGIAVRACAPFVVSKGKDPAVIVIDEKARFVIPILSGHLGGANDFSNKIAEYLGSIAVITTATDINNCFAVDLWAKQNGCHIDNLSQIKIISSAILRGETIGFNSDFPVTGSLPSGLRYADSGETGICITLNPKKQLFNTTMRLIPKIFCVGMGCRKSISDEAIENAFLRALEKNDIPIEAVNCITTIDIKQNEPALLSLCEKYNIPLKIFNAELLSQVKGNFTPSEFVKGITGVDNVCERAAVCASDGQLIASKSSMNGVTTAIAKIDWRVTF